MSDRLVSYPSLVGEGMARGSKATSGHISSLRLDDKDAHPSRNVPSMEEWMGSLERELSTYLLEDEMEGEVNEEIDKEEEEYKQYDEENGEEEDGEEEGEEEEKEEREEADGGGEGEVVASSSSGDNYRPFILPSIWSGNDFLSKISKKVFDNLRPHFHILDNVPIRMASKREKCCSGQTTNVAFYEAILMVGLRLPFTKLHR